MHAVDGLLHLLVIALASDFHAFPQIAATDQPQHAVTFADRDQDGVEHDVHAAQHLGVSALELIGLAAFGELALLGGVCQPLQLFLKSHQHFGDLDQGLGDGIVLRTDVDLRRQVAGGNGLRGGSLLVDGLDAAIEVILEDVEVAIIVVGDLRGNVPLGNLIDIIGGDVQWPDHRVERFVDTLHDLAEIALVLTRIRTGRKLAFDGGLGQQIGIGDERIYRLDAAIEVILEDVEIAIIFIGDLGRDRRPSRSDRHSWRPRSMARSPRRAFR